MFTRRAVLAAVVFALVLGLTGSAESAPTGFVTRVGTQLYLNGQPYRFVGLNFFQANMTTAISNCSSWAANSDLDNQLKYMGPGHNVLRAWFFQDMATTNGKRDWSAFDHTLAVAAAHGMKVIATLGDQWNYCEGPYKDESWYTGGYKTTVLPGDVVPYHQWVQEAVTRYANNPTIALWELLNEPQITKNASSSSCPVDAEAVMQSWASDVSSLIKSLDPNHLVSLGTGGNGNCGLLEQDYATVYSMPTLDVCTFHDYWGATVALDTDPNNGIQLRIDECDALGKPIYAGESGIRVQDVSSLQERAADFAAKLSAQVSAGAAGFVAWNWFRVSDVDYRIGPGDPTLSTLSTAALPGTSDQTPPSVTLTSPTAGTLLGGSVTLRATASDNVAVARVDFLVDGQTVGSATSSPYSVTWNSRLVPDGNHTISARAVDTFGNATTSNPITVSVANRNLLQNASLEAASGSTPTCWQLGGYSTNSYIWTRTTDGHSGSYAESLTISSYTSGDRKLVSSQDSGACAPAVSAGESYTVSAWYKGDAQPYLYAYYRSSSGSWIYWGQSAKLPLSSAWTQASWTTPAVPSGATMISVGLGFSGVGALTMDDFDLHAGS
jgi:hypothetical protein